MSLTSVCVFCGASSGNNPVYREAAITLGRTLAERKLTLVYGGGAVGLMGIVADAVLEAGGEVIGIIPHSLNDLEIGHKGLTRLEVVDGMHARKARMAELADAFIALPGGLGRWRNCSKCGPGANWGTTASRWACWRSTVSTASSPVSSTTWCRKTSCASSTVRCCR